MRIVIDLQGAQGCSRNRGIGRYALALALGMARNKGTHDVHIALSDLFPGTIEPIREAFNGVLPKNNIHLWCAEPGVASNDPANARRRRNAEIQREAFIASLRPDMAVLTSLFEGLEDDVVVSVNEYAGVPTAVILYDLIPFIYKDIYLTGIARSAWYYEKLVQLRQADLILAISGSSRVEGIDLLGIETGRIVDIAAGADSYFRPRHVSASYLELLRERFGLRRHFVMYTGGIDWRKNIEGLIRAYAGLPESLRRKHQLAIVCAIQPEERSKLEQCAKEMGLERDELAVTGFVSDEDLLALYNACRLFVFPSLHEGFGLPALEAMQCGKAVIASNTSSMPQVVGRRDALFDPRDDAAITASLKQVMEDDVFRAELERHGPMQAAKFSWDLSAQRAIAAIETIVEDHKSTRARQWEPDRKRLAYVSPLPPERSGISDYSVELLQSLNKFYKIDVIVDQPSISDNWIVANCRQHQIGWFREHFSEYDRIVYHFGNSHFHKHMFELLELAPGVVVLHDFYLSGIQNYRGDNVFLRALKESHGYHAVLEHLAATSAEKAMNKYPLNLEVLQSSIGVIVHSETSRRLTERWYGTNASNNLVVVPQLRTPSQVTSKQREDARKLLLLPKDAILLCSFGILGPMKLNDRLISAFLASNLTQDSRVNLVFVGESHGSEYGKKLCEMILGSGIEERIRITGWADLETFRTYLQAADIAVQLRGVSRGESSRAILDCMSHGLPTVANANGAMAEIDHTGVWMLDNLFENYELTEALETLAQDPMLRKNIGAKAQDIIRTMHSPDHCADLYFDAIEGFYVRDSNEVGGMMRKFSARPLTNFEATTLASTLSRNFPPQPRLRQLLVDISELVNRDSKTGIQRVVRAILVHWLLNPPQGWSVEPVYATLDQPGYRYATRYTCAFLEMDASWVADEMVDAWAGDIFIGLDLQLEIVPFQKKVLDAWYRSGVDIRFVVYDLLPVLRPEFFCDGVSEYHARWLATITSFDGAVCISQSVARELRDWSDANATPRSIPFAVDWVALGADLRKSKSSSGLPTDAKHLLTRMREAPTFLMVGTVEPRKGYRQALAAFEILWEKGIEAILVVVGKKGWMVEDFVESVRQHQELGRRLFWPENVADEFLEQIYSASTCLVAASEGEGFGLPVIEAAQHGLPIIARDLPVFRETAGEHAFYFDGLEAADLAAALTAWLELYQTNTHVSSSGIKWLTWAQSAEMLLALLGIGTTSTEDENPYGLPGRPDLLSAISAFETARGFHLGRISGSS